MAAARAAWVALGIMALLLAPAGAQAASISGTLDASGAVSLGLQGTDPNGSTLRAAMDGNFAPLVDSLPLNATEQATILSAISLQESGLVGSLLFGNRDGTVEANEVTMFETLIQDAGTAFSSTGISSANFALTGLVALELDGSAATSTKLGGVAFTGAVGPVSSGAPVGVDVTIDLEFPSSGSSHTLTLGTNVTGLGLGLSLFAPDIDVNLTFPTGTSVTGSTGFTSISTASDTWGWSAPSIAGTFSPASSPMISVSYGPAFPTGDAVAIGVPVGVGAVLLTFLLLRRRRRRRSATSTPSPSP